jgi:uncharacterized membrane protein YedE/YeeE
MKAFGACLFGLLFGLGLLLSGMTDPARVLGFLDWTGQWDPSLAFVMGGAVLSAAPLFAIARRRGRPVLGTVLDAPASTRIDRRLVIGAGIFGIGWGLAGICPGPALVNMGIDAVPLLAFVIPMTVGLLAARR